MEEMSEGAVWYDDYDDGCSAVPLPLAWPGLASSSSIQNPLKLLRGKNPIFLLPYYYYFYVFLLFLFALKFLITLLDKMDLNGRWLKLPLLKNSQKKEILPKVIRSFWTS